MKILDQLTPKQVAAERRRLWTQQNKRCPLCSGYITWAQTALDHDHVSGRVRGVLHKNCNGIEGRILQWVRRQHADNSEFLRNLIEYWGKDYTANALHPNHMNDDQKKAKLYRKRMRSAKRESTKAKYRALLKALKGE